MFKLCAPNCARTPRLASSSRPRMSYARTTRNCDLLSSRTQSECISGAAARRRSTRSRRRRDVSALISSHCVSGFALDLVRGARGSYGFSRRQHAAAGSVVPTDRRHIRRARQCPKAPHVGPPGCSGVLAYARHSLSSDAYRRCTRAWMDDHRRMRAMQRQRMHNCSDLSASKSARHQPVEDGVFPPSGIFRRTGRTKVGPSADGLVFKLCAPNRARTPRLASSSRPRMSYATTTRNCDLLSSRPANGARQTRAPSRLRRRI